MGFWDLKIVRLLDYKYLRVLSYKNLGLEHEENFKLEILGILGIQNLRLDKM